MFILIFSSLYELAIAILAAFFALYCTRMSFRDTGEDETRFECWLQRQYATNTCTEFKCTVSQKCLKRDQVCDGVADCPDEEVRQSHTWARGDIS